MLNGEKRVFIGCGILRKEIRLLAAKNGWSADYRFLDSSMHYDFERLEKGLAGQFLKNAGRPIVVCYGACHPLIDTMVRDAGAVRTASQNCVEMLLGPEEFTSELEQGAFFLIEDWAGRFKEITMETFGNNEGVAREIFRGDRKYLLGLRTRCSGDFSREAEAASEFIGLPLRWRDVTLDVLETVLGRAFEALESA
jgi:Protein of unknown function (DUF1638)